MSWNNANAFSTGLLAGFGFIDSINQRKRQIDLQERTLAENNRRYEIDRARVERMDALALEDRDRQIELYNRDTSAWQHREADRLRSEEALRILAPVDGDFDKLEPGLREFVVQQANNDPVIGSIYGNYLTRKNAAKDRAAEQGRYTASLRGLAEQILGAGGQPAAQAPPPPPDSRTDILSPSRAYGDLPPSNPALTEPPVSMGKAYALPQGWTAPTMSMGSGVRVVRPESRTAPTASSRPISVGQWFYDQATRSTPAGERYAEEYKQNPWEGVRRYYASRGSLTDAQRQVTDRYIAPLAAQSAREAADELRKLNLSGGVDPSSPAYKRLKNKLDTSLVTLQAASTEFDPTQEASLRQYASGDVFRAGNEGAAAAAASIAADPNNPQQFASQAQLRGAVTVFQRMTPDQQAYTRRQVESVILLAANGILPKDAPAKLLLGLGAPAAAGVGGVGGTGAKGGNGLIKPGDGFTYAPAQDGSGMLVPVVDWQGNPLRDSATTGSERAALRGMDDRIYGVIEQFVTDKDGKVNPTDVAAVYGVLNHNREQLFALAGFDPSMTFDRLPEETINQILYPMIDRSYKYLQFQRAQAQNRPGLDIFAPAAGTTQAETIANFDTQGGGWSPSEYISPGFGDKASYNSLADFHGISRPAPLPQRAITDESVSMFIQDALAGRGTTADLQMALLGPDRVRAYLERRRSEVLNRPPAFAPTR